MTLQTDRKIVVPTNPDAFQPTANLKTMADTSNVLIVVANQAERDALPAADGWHVFRSDLGVQQVRSGGVWRRIGNFMEAGGSVTVNIPVSTAAGTAVVTLPTGFTLPPIIQATINASTGNNSYKLQTHVYAHSATQFTVDLRTIDGTGVASSYALAVMWSAKQATSASAAG